MISEHHYYTRTLVDHSAALLDLNDTLKKQALQRVTEKSAARSTALRNMWDDVDSVFSIVVTNRRIASKKKRYLTEIKQQRAWNLPSVED